MKFANTITIKRGPAVVFAYLAHLENLPQWNYAILETRKLTTGPVNVGSRYGQTRANLVPGNENFEVTEFEPDHKLTIRGSLNSLPAQISYTLRPDGNATTLTNTVNLQPAGPLSLLAPLATPRIKSAVAANLDVLKRTLERA
jgi:Polyketide cyclase / dehydrase and lipid transport